MNIVPSARELRASESFIRRDVGTVFLWVSDPQNEESFTMTGRDSRGIENACSPRQMALPGIRLGSSCDDSDQHGHDDPEHCRLSAHPNRPDGFTLTIWERLGSSS